MKKPVLLLILFALFSTLNAQKDNRLKDIEKDLNAILDITQAPGFAVAITEGDKIIYSKGFGYSDYENKILADENTLFAIGSSSKAFTSALLGQLRNEEKLSFDDSPIKYIPELRFYNEEMNNNIIIKDLMCHRTGLPRHDFSWYIFPSQNKDSLLLRVQHHEPFTGVRQQWHYNNFMFLTQGVITERITGKTWEENLAERFFGPLNMSRTGAHINDLKESENTALGYQLENDSIISKMDYYDISGMSPAGSINSSVRDMSNWMIAWLNDGKYNDQEVLPPSYINEALSSQMIVGSGYPDDEFPDMHLSNYGYGWFISSYRGHYRAQHGGNIDGFSANVALFPSDSLGIVVLTNQNASSVPNLVRNTIADRMLKTDKTDWAKRFKERQEKNKADQAETESNSASSKTANTKPSHILHEYTGTYSNPGYGEFEITTKNDSLFAQLPLVDLYLSHYHYDVFEPFEIKEDGIDTTGAGGLKVNFASNDAGDISHASMKLEAMIDPIKFTRAPKSIDVDKATLDRYVGEYELAGMAIKVYTKNDTTLYVFVAGQPEYELVATSIHKFNFKALEGFKVEFTEADDQSIKEMTLIQPNGTFKTTRK